MANGPLSGYSILILEDEFLIAMDIEQICLDCGALETHIVHQLEQLDDHLVHDGRFDAAVLDLKIGGQSTIPVARALAGRNIPFVFATGMGRTEEIDSVFPGVAVVPKPYSGEDLVNSLTQAIAQSRPSRESA